MPKKRRTRKPPPQRRPAPKPPANALAYAAAYQCGDCNSDTELVPDPLAPGVWKLNIYHDDGCPVLKGHVSLSSAGASAASQVPGSLYVNLEER